MTTASKRSTWDLKKAKLKQKFPILTDADLDFEESRKGEMLSKLQIKTLRTAKELQAIIGIR
jgi:hypothetical protein